MAGGGRVHPVDNLGGDVQRAVEAERHVRAEEVVVDGLGEPDDVQPLGGEEPRRLVRAVAAQHHQAVQAHLVVMADHLGDAVNVVLADAAHHLEGLAGHAQNRSAQS